MALVELPDFATGFASVRAEDVEAVRQGVPEKLAQMRSLLRGGKLGNLLRDVRTLFELLTDRSFPVPWSTTAAVVFGLAYFLMSVDLIPDVLPVVGFLDDAAVLAEVVYLVSGDIRRFRAHRASKALGRAS
ncbi:MAG: YkvA family protein [Polyangiaceae bacterium]